MNYTYNDEKILIVDDDPSASKVFRISLSMRGYSVNLVQSGVDALDQVRRWHPDLVIADVNMSTMNNVEFCRCLRTISDVPIIVFSAEKHLLIKVEALDAGANDYVIKPFSMLEVHARIRAILRRKSDPS